MYRFICTLALIPGLALAAPAAPVPPAKQALVERVLAKMSLEQVGLQMLQRPITDALRQARVVLEGRVSADKQEAALKDIGTEVAKFYDAEAPAIKASTAETVRTAVAPLLAERFTEEELKQLEAILASPVRAKFEALAPEIHKALGEAVVKANGPRLNPKLTELQNKIGLRLRAAAAQ